MKYHDIVSLGSGVFQLEKGGQTKPKKSETVLLLFASIETDLTSRTFEQNVSAISIERD